MQLEPVLRELRATLDGHGALAGSDPAVADAIASLADALQPALRLAALQLAQQAAAEVAAQLDDRQVDVVMDGEDPVLRVGPPTSSPSPSPAASEDFDARITLRLPPTLKALIEDAATGEGGSVNSWVVDALDSRARRSGAADRGSRVTEGFDL